MAADLVKSSNTLQTLEHDLESFFWVLLWIILTQVPCWDIELRSQFINDTMRPNVYGQSGSQGKITFLTSNRLQGGFKIPNNTTLPMFLSRVKLTVAARHHLDPSLKKFNPKTGDDEKLKSKTRDRLKMDLTAYHKGLEYLKDHNVMLGQFKDTLHEEWPSNDKAVYQAIIAPKSTIQLSNPGSKWSRSMVEENGTIFFQPSSSK